MNRSDSELLALREMVLHWQSIAPRLEEIRRRELQALNYGSTAAIINDVLELADLTPAIRTTSGLVEQQRIFQKARK